MINQPWLETCAQAGEFLYGVFPYAILKRMYELKESGEPREDMIKAVIDSPALLLDYMDDPFLPFAQLGYKEGGYFQPTIATKGTDLYRFFEKLEKQGNPYARMHMIGDEHSLLVRNQGDVEFYIPTATEIEELVNNGYIETPQMKALVKEGANEEKLRALWGLYSTDELDMMDAIKEVLGTFDSFTDINQINAKMRYVNEFMNSINLRVRRGWAPEALNEKLGSRPITAIRPMSTEAARMYKKMEREGGNLGIQVDYSGAFTTVRTAGSQGETIRRKIGQNDPCPCGSGKKYKKCCGRYN